MILYFSGIAGASEREMLIEAGVNTVLVDQFDIKNAEGFPTVALDSGAYRVFKKGGMLDVDAYRDVVVSREWSFAVAPDVIGEAEATYHNWTKVRDIPSTVPVWHWSDDTYLLERYLDERQLVGIGGLVQLMRIKDEQMLTDLKTLCEKHPQRFHIFGVNWLKAIEQLKDLVYSGDTSKFLDGGRYSSIIFQHSRTGHLTQAPSKVLTSVFTADGVPYSELDRVGRCVESAINMREFCMT